MNLSAAKIAMIENAALNGSRDAIKGVFLNRLKNNIGENLLVGRRNRYQFDTTRRFEDDISDPSKDLNLNSTIDYVASSSILHCADGWDFLGTATKALLGGNFSHSIHLAYYAELRAAMSLMASFGIGILNNRHVYIDMNNQVHNTTSNIGTHKFAWIVFKKWVDNSTNASALLNLISISGHSIHNWISADTSVISAATSNLQAKQWLELWSVDLEKIASDQYMRNEVSYRPRGVSYKPEYSASTIDELSFLSENWTLCEPGISSKFNKLDLHLLREVIYGGLKFKTGHTPSDDSVKRAYTRLRDALGLSGNLNIESFMSSPRRDSKCSLFDYAIQKQKLPNGEYQPFGIFSRAFLLLRISTGAVQESLKHANIAFTDLQFWFEKNGVKSGFWEPGGMPDSLDDLWQDVEVPLNEIKDKIESNSPMTRSMAISTLSFEISILSQMKRIFMWGII